MLVKTACLWYSSEMIRQLLWCGLLLRLAWGTAAADRPPNILFCFADDWGRYASIYATLEQRPSPNQVVRTPNIDRVARQGVLFRNAYVNAPSCTPCRSSLLSGRYFFRTGRGAILNGAQWDASLPVYPLLLKESGYHIGKTFKVWSPGTPADAPYGGQAHAYEKSGRKYNNYSENVTALVREGVPLAEARRRMEAEVRGNFESFLAARPAGQPFCYWFGPTLTHRTWEKGSGKALWNINPDALKGRLPSFLPDVPEVREDFADYLGEVQAFDSGVGVLLEKLAAIGELTNTVVVVSGDHGAPGFPHGKCNLYDFGVGVSLSIWWPGQPGGRVVDDFTLLMDLAPTFLELGGLKPPAGMDGRSLVNILRSPRAGLVESNRTFVITGRERHVAGAREGNRPYPHRALRNERYLYIRNFQPDRWPMGAPNEVTETNTPSYSALEQNTYVAFADMDASPTKAWLVHHRQEPQWKPFYDLAFGQRPAEELYDLQKDLDEINNLAADPAHASIRAALAAQLMEVLTRAGDPRVVGEQCLFELPPFAGGEAAARRK
jgi:arylsulfatase A-like enzyme